MYKTIVFLLALSAMLIIGCGAAPDVKLVPIDPPGIDESAGVPLAGQAHGIQGFCYSEQQLQRFFSDDQELLQLDVQGYGGSKEVTIGDSIDFSIIGQWVFKKLVILKNCQERVEIDLVPVNSGQFSNENPNWITNEDFSNNPTAETAATSNEMGGSPISIDETFNEGKHYILFYTCKEVETGDEKELNCNDGKWVAKEITVSY